MEPGKIIFQGRINSLDIVIRYLHKNDLDLLWQFINTISKEQTFVRFQGEEISLKEEEKYLKDQLDKMKNRKAFQLLIFEGKKMAGISGIVMKDRTEQHEGVFGIIMVREYRGKGLGKKLMEIVLSEAKSNVPQLKIVTLDVFSNNPIAQALYRSFGFKEYGRLPEGIMHKGDLVDKIEMYKKL